MTAPDAGADDMPGLWWSPTGGLIRGDTNGGYDDAERLVTASTAAAGIRDPEVLDLARNLARLGVALSVDPSFDEMATAGNAWLYQLASGWDCERGCEVPDEPGHVCTAALDGIAERFGWPGWLVRSMRRGRMGQRLLLAIADRNRMPGSRTR